MPRGSMVIQNAVNVAVYSGIINIAEQKKSLYIVVDHIVSSWLHVMKTSYKWIKQITVLPPVSTPFIQIP